MALGLYTYNIFSALSVFCVHGFLVDTPGSSTSELYLALINLGRRYTDINWYFMSDAENATVSVQTKVPPSSRVYTGAGTADIGIPNKLHINYTGISYKGIKLEASLAKSGIFFAEYDLHIDAMKVPKYEKLGTSYVIPSYKPALGGYGYFVVIGTQSNTRVNVTLKCDKRIVFNNTVYSDGDRLQVSLSELQTVQILDFVDFIGTTIESSHPVAVLTGSQNSPADSVSEYVLPTSQWSSEYIIPVMASLHKSAIIITNESVVSLILSGQHVQKTYVITNGSLKIDLIPDVLYSVLANNSVYVTMFGSMGEREPSVMITIPPETSFSTEITFRVPQWLQLFRNEVGMVTRTSDIAGIQINGFSPFSYGISPKAITLRNTEYLSFTIRPKIGLNKISSKTGKARFGAILYGINYYFEKAGYGIPLTI